MRNVITRFIDQYLDPRAATTDEGRDRSLRVAAAVLLVEVMQADYDIKDNERSAIMRALRASFLLSESEAREVLHEAEEQALHATSLYDFTSLVNDKFSYEDKVQIVANMWQVAYADGDLDKYEEYIIRKVADLLYVAHSDFIRAKLLAQPKG